MEEDQEEEGGDGREGGDNEKGEEGRSGLKTDEESAVVATSDERRFGGGDRVASSSETSGGRVIRRADTATNSTAVDLVRKFPGVTERHLNHIVTKVRGKCANKA